MNAPHAGRHATAPAGPRLTLAAVCVAAVVLPMALTGASVALPDINGDLHVGLVSLQWVVNAYNVTFAACMLACGALADLLGRRRMFTAGLVTILVAGVVSAVSPGIVLLDLSRGLAGIGGAAVMTAGSALLAQTFDGPARAKAFGALGTAFGTGLALGPFTAGFLVDAFGWRSVFVSHAVLAAAVLAVTGRLAESRNPRAMGVDKPGTATFTAALFALILGIIEGPQLGWAHPLVLALLAGAALFLAAFVTVERRVGHPMFDLGLLARPRFLGICLMPFVLSFVFVGLLAFLPTYLIGVGDYSTDGAGAAMLPLTLPILTVPVVAGFLTQRLAMRTLLALSLALVAAGAAWLTVIGPSSGFTDILGPLLVMGAGVGVSFGLLDGAAVSVVPAERAGMAAGMFNTMRLTGEAVAVAGMGTVLVSVIAGRLGDHTDEIPGRYRGHVQNLADTITQGDLAKAASHATPGAARDAFTTLAAGSYTDALHLALWILAALSALCIPAVWTLLTRRQEQAGPAAGTNPASTAREERPAR
ncbi:MFS transporter [Streptomyces sp. NPDC049577]|uniref:MFS transporter n=1 Tax=Streptomyces sp. NPDC049577 TaxID=3155153 RepID=UPI003437B8A7